MSQHTMASRTRGAALQDGIDDALDGHLDPGALNHALAAIAEFDDVSASAIAFRRASNAQRIAGEDGHEAAKASLAAGGVIATALYEDRTVAEFKGKRIRVRSTGALLTTGVLDCSHVLVVADTVHGPTTFMLDATAVVDVDIKPFIGMKEAKNAFVTIEAEVGHEAIVGAVGEARTVIESPYEAGLTFGACAAGGGRQARSLLERFERDGSLDQRVAIGHLTAQLAAADALVEVTAAHAPRAGWYSRAAKLAACDAALAAGELARRLIGPAAYAAEHPLPGLLRDLEGLAFQAPTDTSAALVVGDITTKEKK